MNRILLRLFVPVIVVSALTGCASAKKAAIEDALHEIWDEGDLTVIDRAYSPELAYEIKEFVRENRALYSDIQITVDDSIISGTKWVNRWTLVGTHRDLGTRVTLSGATIRVREGGQFVEQYMYYDRKAVYDQLGFQVIAPDGVSPYDKPIAVERGSTDEPAVEEAPVVEETPVDVEKVPPEE